MKKSINTDSKLVPFVFPDLKKNNGKSVRKKKVLKQML
jgi:hypothetical protein